jgi:lysophospholipase L1-like esterase
MYTINQIKSNGRRYFMKIVCIGSDITRGFPLDKAQGWVSLWEGTSGFEIVNKGESGSTAEHMVHRFKADVLDEKPDMAVIITGTIDFMHYAKEPTEVMSSVNHMVKSCHDNGIKPVVVTPIMIDIPNACKVMAGDACIDYDAVNHTLRKYRELILKSANDGKFEVWDYQAKFEDAIKGKDRASYFVDGIHPGVEAHKILAGFAGN